jgi:hypothetical protein
LSCLAHPAQIKLSAVVKVLSEQFEGEKATEILCLQRAKRFTGTMDTYMNTNTKKRLTKMANLLILPTGATGLEPNLPELHSGHSNQIADILSRLLALGLLLSLHGLTSGAENLLIN